VVSALRSLDRGGCVLSRSRRTAVCDFWWRTSVVGCLRASSGRSSNPWKFVSKESRSCDPAVATRTPPNTALPPPLHCFGGAWAWGVQGAITRRSLRLAIIGGVVRGSKSPAAMQALSAIRGKLHRVWRLPNIRGVL
jgi:hypothetical protein